MQQELSFGHIANPLQTRTVKSELDFDCEWTQKYGLEGANIIRKAVDENMETYLYLKQHVLKVTSKNHGYGPQNG